MAFALDHTRQVLDNLKGLTVLLVIVPGSLCALAVSIASLRDAPRGLAGLQLS